MRPVYDLRCGILTLREKIVRRYPGATVALGCRSYLADLVREQNHGIPVNQVPGERCLFINGRVLAGDDIARIIPAEGEDALYVSKDIPVAARVSGRRLEEMKNSLAELFTRADVAGLPKVEVPVKTVIYSWDLVNNNGEELVSDFRLLTTGERNTIRGKVYEGAFLLKKESIFIGEGSTVKPGVVLDAESGPIYIGKNAKIFPNATIEGPAYVGDSSLIKIGAKIYENTSIGPLCKVGGEVEASIIHSHSNKQHDGFLGHAYLGQWVNLGADTNNSDLKNNYGNVKVVVNHETVDSGSLFVGLTMGDHSKSGINTMFNTGTVVGMSSNVFGAGFPEKFVPSFAWGGADDTTTYDLEKSLAVARRVMARRKMTMSPAEERVFRQVFELTRDERKKSGVAP
jgi:UDP-N-acetylglucosamine diphosphorylase/glucosamine-1-phosphate N-acetyltransferase